MNSVSEFVAVTVIMGTRNRVDSSRRALDAIDQQELAARQSVPKALRELGGAWRYIRSQRMRPRPDDVAAPHGARSA